MPTYFYPTYTKPNYLITGQELVVLNFPDITDVAGANFAFSKP